MNSFTKNLRIKSTVLQRVVIAWLLCFSIQGAASIYPLPSGNGKLIGKNELHTVKQGDYFQELAERYDVGFLGLMAANPALDPFLLKPGQAVIIPKQMLLPFAKREGIVINVAELRLYYFLPDEPSVAVFPIGIGRQGLSTPKVVSFISDKREDPEWRPTAAMRERHLKDYNELLPEVVPAGPENPFGKYALRIGRSAYLIHGSNKRFGIGMRASSGCIRLYDDDIKWLFDNVPVDAPVRIVDQPIKMSYEAPQLKLLEVHQPLTDDELGAKPKPFEFTDAVMSFIGEGELHKKQLKDLTELPTGLVTSLKRIQ